MGRESREDPIARIASRDAIDRFQPTKGQIYDISLTRLPNDNDLGDLFRVDIQGPPKSRWNQSCARVFARSFLRRYPKFNKAFGPDASARVENAFSTHLAYLRNVYVQQQKTIREKKQEDQDHRRRERVSHVSTHYRI